METSDPPNDNPGASKQVVLIDIQRILREGDCFLSIAKCAIQKLARTKCSMPFLRHLSHLRGPRNPPVCDP